MFGLPGIGRLAVDSVTNRDFVTVQGVVALVTVGYVVVNFLVDLAYFALDPRVRRAGA
jgi:peptide/nickel transport system permease protein